MPNIKCDNCGKVFLIKKETVKTDACPSCGRKAVDVVRYYLELKRQKEEQESSNNQSKDLPEVVVEVVSKEEYNNERKYSYDETRFCRCPECSRIISKKAQVCPGCGARIKKKIGKIFVVVIIAVLTIVIITGAGLIYTNLIEPRNKYSTALELIDDGLYDDSISILSSIEGYKDSEEIIKMAYYMKGQSLLLDEAYEEALVSFTKAEDYNDAQIIADNVKATMEKMRVEEEKKERLDKLKLTLKTAYNNCYNKDRIFLSGDGMSLTVDSEDQWDISNMLNIYDIIDKLGLPDSLKDEMAYTNALMGRRSESYEDYDVSWNYHPDNGLDVTFKIKE